jgi:HAD superfamily hydrolase (TIGR01549 family)
MKPKALFFDFYGTIVEEADEYVADICNKISLHSEITVSPSEIAAYWFKLVPQMCAESYNDNFRLQKEIAVDSLQMVLNKYNCNLKTIHEYWKSPKIFPESKEVLSKCHLPKCIVTNIDDEFIYSALQEHSLSFEYIVTSESCKSYKPRTEIFDKAIAMVGLSSEEVLHIGDSYPNDITGAKAANISVMWINRKNKKRNPSDILPDYDANNLRGLLDLQLLF